MNELAEAITNAIVAATEGREPVPYWKLTDLTPVQRREYRDYVNKLR